MSGHKFYKTTLKVEVLSEKPFEWDDLSDVHCAITTGDCSGKVSETSRRVLTAKQVAKELRKQASDPEFFRLDEKGNELGESDK